jgi:hypothetical protein
MRPNAVFFLRHLLQRDRRFNIPYIILKHMQRATVNTDDGLPYAHLIAFILMQLDIQIPEEVKLKPVNPTNLVRILPCIGWT